MMVELVPSAEWIWGAFVIGVGAVLWQAGDRRYVRRVPYHEAINTLTANSARVQEDVNQLKTAVAVLTNSMVAMSANVQEAMKHNERMADSVAAIQINVATLTGTWESAWFLKYGQAPKAVLVQSPPRHPESSET